MYDNKAYEGVEALVRDAEIPVSAFGRFAALSSLVAAASHMHDAALQLREESKDDPEAATVAQNLVRRTRLTLDELVRMQNHASDRSDDARAAFQARVLEAVEAIEG